MSGSPFPETIRMRTLVQHIDHMQRRVLQDCIIEQTRRYWIKRAEQFEAARPKHGDFTGRMTREELSAQWCRLTTIANACRSKAEHFVLIEADLTEDVDNVLCEAA